MKIAVFAAIALIATAVVAQDGTTSVLKGQPTPATATADTTATATAAEPCVETAKVVKLAPWHVRRLNRIADRQEAREARKCCCDKCECASCDKCDCCKTKAVVVESRR